MPAGKFFKLYTVGQRKIHWNAFYSIIYYQYQYLSRLSSIISYSGSTKAVLLGFTPGYLTPKSEWSTTRINPRTTLIGKG